MPSKPSLPEFTVHTIIKNEDRWIWYALMSVIDVASKIIVFDTGSTDKTPEIIQTINSPKIVFEHKPQTTRSALVKLRQEQLDRTTTPWFLLVDGDEIWPQKNLFKLLKVADKSSQKVMAFFTRTRNCVGDISHYLPESKGQYHIKGITGHLNIRLIRRHPKLSVEGEYPLEAYTLENQPLQTREANLEFVDTWYLHTTHLPRSTNRQAASQVFDRAQKQKFRLGIKMKSEELPAVFFKPRPAIVPAPITSYWQGFKARIGI